MKLHLEYNPRSILNGKYIKPYKGKGYDLQFYKTYLDYDIDLEKLYY